MAAKNQTAKNLYVRALAKKSCPNCGEKNNPLSFGEYVSGKWRTIEHCCEKCFPSAILPLVERFKLHNNNRAVDLVSYQGFTIPSWAKLEK